MPTLPDARSDNPVLNDSFDFSRYPTFKTRNANLSTKPRELRHRTRGRMELFSYSNRGSPSGVQLSRNVSEPQLVSSTNYMRESWFTGFASTRTVGDIANISTDDDTFTVISSSQSTTVTCETFCGGSFCEVDIDQPPKTICEDSYNITGPSDEGASFYSMDSADQDAHPLLLSMPIIPQIKLERKATVRQPDPAPSLDATQSRYFLSPRIRDLRTPARMSSRRYGRILARTSPEAVACDATADNGGAHDHSEAARRPETELPSVRSTSELSSNSLCPSKNDEGETIDSPHSDVLLSMIDEAGSSPGSCRYRGESAVDELPKVQSAPPKHPKHGHQRSSLTHSVSLSSIVHAVAEGYVTLDLLLRKPRPKPKATTKPTTREGINAHDPTSRWVPKQGQIVIKVFVPSTDDIWMFRVPQAIDLTDFTSKVVKKLGFTVSFSGSLWDEPRYYFRTDERFKSWVKGRVRFGRNLPIVAHVLPPLPFVKLSVDWDGSEVWCYA